jgi:hypothetical protein
MAQPAAGPQSGPRAIRKSTAISAYIWKQMSFRNFERANFWLDPSLQFSGVYALANHRFHALRPVFCRNHTGGTRIWQQGLPC